jgi:hypothetical protein
VPNWPFAAGPTANPNIAPSQPILLATEISGKFLHVGYANGDSTTTSALIPFAIDAVNLAIVLTPQLSRDFGNGAPVQVLADPSGWRLYVGRGPAGSQSASSAGTTVYSIDSSNGVLTAAGNAGGGSDLGRAIAIDPQGRFFFDGWGQSQGFIDSGVISPVHGTSSASFTQDRGQGVYPLAIFVESSGKYLYAQTNSGLLIYAINQTTGATTFLSGRFRLLRLEQARWQQIRWDRTSIHWSEPAWMCFRSIRKPEIWRRFRERRLRLDCRLRKEVWDWPFRARRR